MVGQSDENVVIDNGSGFAAKHRNDVLGDEQVLARNAFDEALEARKLRGVIEGEDLFEGRRIKHISALATKGDTFAHGDALGSRIVDHHDIVVVDTLDIHGCDLGSSNRLANQGEDDVAARDGTSRALGQ